MLQMVEGNAMAKKRPDEPAPAEAEEAAKARRYSVVIDQDMVRKIRVLAAADDVSPPDWVNNQLRRIVREMWRPVLESLDEE